MIKKGLLFFLIVLPFVFSSGTFAQPIAESGLSCQAYYVANEEPGNPLLINFEDRSTGNMTSWLWSFGDGSYSELQNPIHLFPGPGLYTVCLTVSNPDTSSHCWDKYCDTIYINIIHDCDARFTWVLDSLNDNPRTFLFSDISTGNPNSWLWLFGDGDMSADQNAIHQYKTPGNYRVCLVIAETDSTGVQCYDSTCHDLSTPAYFDLGGHLFTGPYPINNPQSTGDTGIVFLYRMKGNTLIPVDTSRFTQYGYFAFPQRLNGNYLLRAELTRGSSGYPRYFPSYYPSELTWSSCGSVELTDSNSYHSDIHLLPVTDTIQGPGVIRGIVKENDIRIPLSAHSGAEVLVYNEQMKPRTFVFTGVNGNFEISNLPFGTYFLAVEVPGYYSRLTTITLSAGQPLADSVILELFNHDVTGIGEDPETGSLEAGNVYPNPVAEQICFDLYAQRNTCLRAEIWSITGQVRQVMTFYSRAGWSVVTLPAADLAPGFYLLLIHSADGSAVIPKKFIRQ